ncbi:matrixin family metalloprotease [Candidatus Uhrbacteria bacterium]|nr:matrixin family metalloprotease [Candidatus Uhrbacteria bacterium]
MKNNIFIRVMLATMGLFSLSLFFLVSNVYAYVASGYTRPSGNVSFYLHGALVNVGWQGAIDNARSEWNGAGSSFTFSQSGTATRSPSLVQSSTTDGYNDIGALSLDLSYVGFTSSVASGTSIIETDTAYNLEKSFDVNPNIYQYDVESVAVHELGHWLHLDETQSWRCFASPPSMCGSVSMGSTYMRSIESDDINGIQYIY